MYTCDNNNYMHMYVNNYKTLLHVDNNTVQCSLLIPLSLPSKTAFQSAPQQILRPSWTGRYPSPYRPRPQNRSLTTSPRPSQTRSCR